MLKDVRSFFIQPFIPFILFIIILVDTKQNPLYNSMYLEPVFDGFNRTSSAGSLFGTSNIE